MLAAHIVNHINLRPDDFTAVAILSADGLSVTGVHTSASQMLPSIQHIEQRFINTGNDLGLGDEVANAIGADNYGVIVKYAPAPKANGAGC